MDRDSGHLGEIAERRLAGIGLPARVGGKADRRVERQIGADCVEPLRVERQQVLDALQPVKRDDADEMEHQQRERIGSPALLLAGIDAGQPVDGAFHSRERARQTQVSLDDAGDIAAQRFHRRGKQHGEDGDLGPAMPIHDGWSGEELLGSIMRAQKLT